jgi:microcystin-dependent protein
MPLTQVQVLRSSVSGARPAPGSQSPGVLYVNFVDEMLGVIMPDGTPKDLLKTGGGLHVGDYPSPDPIAEPLWWNSTDGRLYVFYDDGNSQQWVSVSGSGGGSAGAETFIGDAPPADPVAGQMWWNSETGILSIYYNDGDSSQWVSIASNGGSAGGAVSSVNGQTGDVLLDYNSVGAAAASHTHAISDVSGLQASLDDKAAIDHNHDTQYAPLVHSHPLVSADAGNKAVLGSDALVYVPAAAATPSGAIMQFAGAAAPNGWMMCDGAAVSRADFAALYAVVGDIYGAGDGSTTFNLPNLLNRVAVGAGSKALASSGGAMTRTPTGSVDVSGTVQNTTLTIAQMPSHGHGTDGGWGPRGGDATATATYLGRQNEGAATGGVGDTLSQGGSQPHAHGFTGTATFTGVSLNIEQPYLVLNYIIKV